MRKIIITLVVMLMIATTFITVVNARVDGQNNLFSKSLDGPFLDRIINFLKNIRVINNTINFFRNLLGLVEDIEEIEPPEIFEYGIYQQDSDKEPGMQTPTDNGISVSIRNFDLKYQEQEGKVEYDMTFDGSTTGDVYGCYYMLVNYYQDGSADFADIWMSPIKLPKLSLADYSMEIRFTGTGPQGAEDWSTFKGRQYFSGILEESEFEIPEEDSSKKLKDVKLFVRAFSDKGLTQWNQDSISIMDEMTDTVYEDPKDKDNGVPGFEIMFLIIALAVAMIIFKRRKV